MGKIRKDKSGDKCSLKNKSEKINLESTRI